VQKHSAVRTKGQCCSASGFSARLQSVNKFCFFSLQLAAYCCLLGLAAPQQEAAFPSSAAMGASSVIHFSIPLRNNKFHYVFPDHLASSAVSHQLFKSVIFELNKRQLLLNRSRTAPLLVFFAVVFLASALVCLVVSNSLASSASALALIVVFGAAAASLLALLLALLYLSCSRKAVKAEMRCLVESLNAAHLDRGLRCWKLRGRRADLLLTLETEERKGSELELEKYKLELIV
jgi:hypothetical protein